MSRPAYIPASDIAVEPPTTEQPGQANETPAVTVKVRSPFQVVHDGHVYRPGDTAEVLQHVAERWLRNRWVEKHENTDQKLAASRRKRSEDRTTRLEPGE